MKRNVLLIVALAALFMWLPAASTATSRPVKPSSGTAAGQYDEFVYPPLILTERAAAVFIVNTTDDAAGDGCTAAHCSLRAAVQPTAIPAPTRSASPFQRATRAVTQRASAPSGRDRIGRR